MKKSYVALLGLVSSFAGGLAQNVPLPTSYQVNVNAAGQNIPGDAANEPSICIDPTNPNRMAVGWRQFDTTNSNFRQSGVAYTTKADDKFFGHPKGLGPLFFTELWERFSYYGMRAILVLYMVASPAQGGLGFDVKSAASIYGTYTMAVYLTALPGGLAAD